MLNFALVKKARGILEQLRILVTGDTEWVTLNVFLQEFPLPSLWTPKKAGKLGMFTGQDMHITQIQFGQQEIWLELMNRLVQNSNLPTKTDISGLIPLP